MILSRHNAYKLNEFQESHQDWQVVRWAPKKGGWSVGAVWEEGTWRMMCRDVVVLNIDILNSSNKFE